MRVLRQSFKRNITRYHNNAKCYFMSDFHGKESRLSPFSLDDEVPYTTNLGLAIVDPTYVD
jgi:hypothetical protein